MVEDVILLIRGCLAGEEEAWDVLHREYAGIALAHLRWKFPAIADDHDDIIQKVFANLLVSGLTNFRGTTKYEFLSYFKAVVRNEALRCIGDNKRKEAGSFHYAQADSDRDSESLEIPDPDAGSRPDRRAEAHDMVDFLAKTLKECALIDQEVYLLKLRGYKDKEISAILDIPMGTVAVKYARTKSKLKEKFEDHV